MIIVGLAPQAREERRQRGWSLVGYWCAGGEASESEPAHVTGLGKPIKTKKSQNKGKSNNWVDLNH